MSPWIAEIRKRQRHPAGPGQNEHVAVHIGAVDEDDAQIDGRADRRLQRRHVVAPLRPHDHAQRGTCAVTIQRRPRTRHAALDVIATIRSS